MFLDMNGPDFFRVQSGGTSRAADPLDPSVIFSGIYEDGQGYLFGLGVANSATAITTYTVNFGQTFSRVPLVFPALVLSQAVVQNGTRWFEPGEVVAPCTYYRNTASARVVAWDFSMVISNSQIIVTTAGFNGTAYFLVVDV
ncbi:hypothetical protein [Methylobacterium gnaphalii]|uniref:Uncharacterized protein n=1 Tax=Methylobacterium gnaphalii TaxID=1010610 RepID=A0A512JMB2_9HYPH|nr:hypothetical protein [Methylobacterium gnaphalii]GEP11109.1 hypothetical protein MGN01_29540 [Methylobacterium gnaphalii]GJD69899.1 hypothetical protein MMMDOFMJ_2838 [Methylobacterium gnaphalii]GLS50387.1 hypothetical protein GCM10007885_32390 [Methylobacterium gnaphalii]